MVNSRCKSCGADILGDYTMLQRLSRLRPWRADRQICEACFVRISSSPSTEEPVSLLSAELRVPAQLAEQTPARDFRTLLRGLYKTAEQTLNDHQGIVVSLGGQTLLAVWSPRISGPNHAQHAMDAGSRLVEDLDSDRAVRRRIRAGVAVHTGLAAVDLIGNPWSHSFEVGGDAVAIIRELAADTPDNQLRASAAILAATDAQ